MFEDDDEKKKTPGKIEILNRGADGKPKIECNTCSNKKPNTELHITANNIIAIQAICSRSRVHITITYYFLVYPL